jgi:hypothetical protein
MLSFLAKRMSSAGVPGGSLVNNSRSFSNGGADFHKINTSRAAGVFLHMPVEYVCFKMKSQFRCNMICS